MGHPPLRMEFSDAAAFERELEQNLKHGRAFIQGAGGIEVLSDCELCLVHPETGAELSLCAQAVMVADEGAMIGVGIELRPFGAEQIAELERFARGEAAPEEQAEDAPEITASAHSEPPRRGPSESLSPATETASVTPGCAPPSSPAPAAGSSQAPTSTPPIESPRGSVPAADPELEAGDAPDDDAGDRDPDTDLDGLDDEGAASLPPDDEADPEDDEAASNDLQQKRPAHERLRRLSQAQQNKIARTGELSDRVMLERLYSKGVWEALLQNPRITVPEVARIARKGSAPRPMIEHIVDNNAWIQAPIVRRALLGNPRLSSEGINKLLRITPKNELKIIHKTTTYRMQVREAARKLLERQQ